MADTLSVLRAEAPEEEPRPKGSSPAFAAPIATAAPEEDVAGAAEVAAGAAVSNVAATVNLAEGQSRNDSRTKFAYAVVSATSAAAAEEDAAVATSAEEASTEEEAAEEEASTEEAVDDATTDTLEDTTGRQDASSLAPMVICNMPEISNSVKRSGHKTHSTTPGLFTVGILQR